MDLWYGRPEGAGAEFRMRVRRPLFAGERGGRRIDVLETEDLGKILLLDGRIALAEADAAAFREMVVHPALAVLPSARSVLVAGGGDGNLLTELLRHAGIERVVVAESDPGLTEAARRFFPELGAAFDDPRAQVVEEDPLAFVRDSRERFDLILVDHPAAEAPGDPGLGQAFYCDCFRILSGDGMLVHRAGSAFFPQKRRELLRQAGKVKRLFPGYRLCRLELPSAETGAFLLGFATKRFDPLEDYDEARWKALGLSTRYYNPATHRAAFALPQYLVEAMTGI
jgi:spermidine synthase